MIFNKYTHMDNDYKIIQSNTVQQILSDDSLQFVAMEKIHGTNLSFIFNGSDAIKCCRRTAVLKSNENFFSYENILSQYRLKIIKLYEEIDKIIKKNVNENITQIQLYGELYGGIYPGIQTIPEIKKIQKGIYYCNTNEFVAYDLKYWTRENIENPKYLDWIDFVPLLNNIDIPIVPIILEDSWKNISKLNPKFESVLFKKHNLPFISENYAEGFVIKPIIEIRYGKNNSRLIWKLKNPSFAENIGGKINSDRKINKFSEQIKLNDSLIIKLSSYVCETRFDNVKSKLIENTSVNDIVKLFYEDIWIDFIDDLNLENIKLNNEEIKELEKKLREFTNKFVRTRL